MCERQVARLGSRTVRVHHEGHLLLLHETILLLMGVKSLFLLSYLDRCPVALASLVKWDTSNPLAMSHSKMNLQIGHVHPYECSLES
jgi:hypothetical protein